MNIFLRNDGSACCSRCGIMGRDHYRPCGTCCQLVCDVCLGDQDCCDNFTPPAEIVDVGLEV